MTAGAYYDYCKCELFGGPLDGNKRLSKDPVLYFQSDLDKDMVHVYARNASNEYNWEGLHTKRSEWVVWSLRIGDRG